MHAFGGRRVTQMLHPWFGLAFVMPCLVLLVIWAKRVRWKPGDGRSLRHLLRHPLARQLAAPPETGYFNAGQKIYFWSVIVGMAVLLYTGIVYWFRYEFPWGLYLACRFLHRAASVVMCIGLVVHVYKATWGEPGTFRSMLRGTVTARWAQIHRPGWYREAVQDATPQIPPGELRPSPTLPQNHHPHQPASKRSVPEPHSRDL